MTPKSITPPDLDWREDGQPVASAFGDTYFSVENGLEESRYVFLKHNGLPDRWQNHPGAFRIIETGFGTGLNFLMTWQAFRQSAPENCWLEYTSIEKFPLNKDQLIQAQALWPELGDLTDRLLQQYPDAVPGFHHLVWPDARIALTLALGDVHDILPQLNGPVHAWYLDGFAPSCNPDMWTDALFSQMRRLCRATASQNTASEAQRQTTCATFTSAGIVRRGMIGAGFQVSKVPGFGRKREMLKARYCQTSGPERPARFDGKPWLTSENHFQQSNKEIVVIGAGLAGCTSARALAERGWKVTVLDKAGISNGGSGNPQGGLYVKLAANDQAVHSDFYLQAFQYATKAITRILGDGDASQHSWRQCGVLQLASNAAEAERQQRFLDVQALPENLVTSRDAQQASELAGITLTQGGLFYPDAGWVNPRHLCHQMLQHPNISIRSQAVTELTFDDDHWILKLGDTEVLNSEQVVLAAAYEAKTLLPEAWLPLKSIRGQLSYLNAEQVPSPNTVLCGQSYMAPVATGQPWLVMGATYNLNDNDPEPRFTDHETNLSHLGEFGPSMPAATLDLIKGSRVGFRCTTPDYLPLVGSIPVTREFVNSYKPMIRNARQIPPVLAPNYTGLWLNVGHGSRGLASTPLCAELLATQIEQTALPVSTDVAEALWPGRFLLRDMVRRRLPKEWYE